MGPGGGQRTFKARTASLRARCTETGAFGCATAVPMQSAGCVHEVFAGDISWRPASGGGDPRGVQPQRAAVQLVLGQPPDRRLNPSTGTSVLSAPRVIHHPRHQPIYPGGHSELGQPLGSLTWSREARENGSNPYYSSNVLCSGKSQGSEK